MGTTEQTGRPGSAAHSRESAHGRGAELLLLFVVLVWALNFPVAKWALERLNILTFNAIRFMLAVGCVGLALPFLSKWKPVARNDWKRLVGLGLLTNVFYQSAFIVGLWLTTAGNAAILFATSPLWTALVNAILYGEKIRARTWGGMALSFAGIVLIIGGSGQDVKFGTSSIWGDLIILAAAFLWALCTNVQKPLVQIYPSMQVTFISLTVGAIVLPLASIPATLATDWSQVTWLHLLATAASGLLSIGVAYIIWAYAVKRIGPTRTGNYGNLVPVVAFVLAYIMLDEQYTPWQVVGAAATVCGVLVARK